MNRRPVTLSDRSHFLATFELCGRIFGQPETSVTLRVKRYCKAQYPSISETARKKRKKVKLGAGEACPLSNIPRVQAKMLELFHFSIPEQCGLKGTVERYGFFTHQSYPEW